MSKLLISACLLGQKVRYDGTGKLQRHPQLDLLRQEKRLVAVCPEVLGGLSTPRPPAEVEPGKTADDVLSGKAKVLTNTGIDVTAEFIAGAHKALEFALKNDISVAVLKARSPSCGSSRVYDGTFSGNVIDGMGVTTAVLKQNGIQVFNEEQLNQAVSMLNTGLTNSQLNIES